MPVTTSQSAKALPQNGTILPVSAASMQTRHILQTGRRSMHHTLQVLTAFALILAFALVCTMLLIVSTGTAYALTATTAPGAQTGLLAAAAFTLATAILTILSVARRPARAKRNKTERRNNN